MKKLLIVLALLLSAHYSMAQPTTWKADPMHSKLTFVVTHKGLSSIFGLFQKFDAAITASKPDFSDAVFTLTADVASINTEVKMRDDDLRSPNFFDAAKYPTMTFKSTSVKNTTGIKDRYKISGDLTIHGITKPVILDVWYRGTQVDPKSNKSKAGFQIKGMIDRTDFNVGPAEPFDISTDVMIQADGEFIKQ